MLTDIYLKNFTVVTELRVELQSGLCVLSGETGAGKSIIVDAVQLALGARADNQVIRHQETKCEITLCFEPCASAKSWLEEHDFSSDECIINRILQRDGRSRSLVNGKPIPLNLLRELSQYLLRVHGQHESYSLLQRQQQEQLVDLFAQNNSLLQEIKKLYQQWRNNKNELKKLQELNAQREEQLSFLQYQLDELDELNLQENEWGNLHHEHRQLHNASQFITQINQAINLTIENDPHNSSLLLQQAINQLESLTPADPQITEVIKLLNTAAIHLQEASDELVSYRDTIDLSPERLQFIENRLGQIYDLARKHHCAAEDLPSVQSSLQEKIDKLLHWDEQVSKLENDIKYLEKSYQLIAKKLSNKRLQAAEMISAKITQAMQTLGMQGGEFSVRLEPQDMSPTGNEKITFWVKTNPGQNTQPLSKVVSGGELSRLSLALQSLIAESEPVPTFIFDEVDVGIGGQTAEVVGELLREFATKHQVFCITHLPQVAAAGQQHYQVNKVTKQNATETQIKLLTSEERIHELARMISGSKISEQTLKHAEQLLTTT